MLSTDLGTLPTTINSKSAGKIEVHGTNVVLLSGLKFIGCGDSLISHVNNLTIWNSTFV